MDRVQLTTAELENIKWEYLHKGREIERRRWEAYEVQISSLCYKHRVPLERHVINGEEVFRCPFRNEHRVHLSLYEQETVRTPVVLPDTGKIESYPIPHRPQRQSVSERS